MMHRPTKDEIRIIRECAQRDAGYRRVEICPATRVHLDKQDDTPHMNIAFVSDDPDFGDTDLFSNAFAWSDFTRGVELTGDGRGIFDFYVYGPIGHDKELRTNVTAHYDGGRLVRVEGTCNGTMWQA